MATDGLGRTLPGYAECGPPRADRTVGIFYFNWLGIYGMGGPYESRRYWQPIPQTLSGDRPSSFHHWGESELGYYRSDDEFVIRKHCRDVDRCRHRCPDT